MLNGLKLHITLLLLAAATVGITPKVSAQSNIEVFGQNRVQNRKFDWKFFDTKHFRVYHYDKAGRQLGRYVAEEAENSIKVVEKKLGGSFPQRFNIILYNSYDDYRQMNIGLKDEAQSVTNARAGSLNLVDDKLVVHFTGQHGDLKHQIRSGMSRVVMCKMIFGDNFKKMVKNALLLNLPQWVTDGYIAYLVDGWDAKAHSEWKGLLDARPKAGFYELAEEKPELAGKAFWKFISNQYSPGMVKTLLYAMQAKTSINKAMKDKETINLKVTKAYDSCVTYFKEMYDLEATRQEMPDSTHGLTALQVPKDNSVIRNIVVSPRGSDIAYVAWKEGRYTVYSQKTAGSGQLSPLLEGGQKDLTEAIDPTYPMLAWNNTGYRMAILYRKGSRTHLRIYNSLKGRLENYVIPGNRFDRVLSMCFTPEDDKLIFSAVRKSQTDLYMFTFKGSKMTNITDDVWDDVAPQYISGGAREGILFLSNRPKPNLDVPLEVNELPTGPMNVFFYNTKTKRPELLQCSDAKKGTVSQPIQYGNENFAYLLDSNGVNNKFVVLFKRDRNNRDSAYSVPITNYNTSIISHQYNPASGDVADVIQVKDKYQVYFHDLQMPGVNVTEKTLQPTLLSYEKPELKPVDKVKIIAPAAKLADNNEEPQIVPEIKSGNAFQTEFSDTTVHQRRKKNRAANLFKATAAPDSSILSVITDSAYVKMKPSPYRLSFKPDFFSIKLDNSILFSQYQSIATGGFKNRSLSALTTLSLNELMEDHRITAGYQLPLDIKASAYFIQYQNFKKRLDWGLLFLRTQDKEFQSVTYVDNQNRPRFQKDQLFKSNASILQADFGYPLDRVRSFRFHTAIRQDKLVQKVTDTLSLIYDVVVPTTYTSMSRLEYVFDNTIGLATNTLHGDRFKLYAEYLAGLNNGNKSCYNFGLDVRHYQKLYKNFILATRLAYAHSDGNYKVQYLVGGVDNPIAPGKPDPNYNGPTDGYGFQMLATTLRGYRQYARTGNNFAVLSNEFRFPVLTTFTKRPIQSSILKNLQLVAFADAASAWTGFLPDAGSMTKEINYPKGASFTGGLNNVQMTFISTQGLALGYGLGLRTSIFGYFVRTDVAWSIDGTSKPMVHLGLGSDF